MWEVSGWKVAPRRRLEGLTYRTGLYNLFQRKVHPGVALDQMAVERFAVFQLNKHRVALGGIQQPEGQLEQRLSAPIRIEAVQIHVPWCLLSRFLLKYALIIG